MLVFRGITMVLLARPALNNLGFYRLSDQIDRLDHLTDWPFPISANRLLEFLAQGAILAVLVLRFARSRRDEERLSSEIEAARLVQQILVPAETPVIPGFRIESLYKPAGEVGGDFFQIIPTPESGALVVIGDVSGKGVPAAMTVSLLVGTLRTLAHYTQSPAEILTAMNQRMLVRSQGGFTTCLVLRVDPDGAITAANAGHLAPYCGGQEINVAGGLPLGLDGQSVYAEWTFELPTAAQLTLVTDGVVEARAKDGELFGFDRSRSISSQSAQQIAQAAEDFGQEDDITVLTVVREFAVRSS
jgi:serine phosphatase RsbU (regulator of sigma subunit)